MNGSGCFLTLFVTSIIAGITSAIMKNSGFGFLDTFSAIFSILIFIPLIITSGISYYQNNKYDWHRRSEERKAK